jgi:AcrR family transcriptional regulator
MTEKLRTKRTVPRSKTFARRKALVGITYELIAAKGLEGLRTRDVAEAAATDTGTLHYHFPSKEHLIQAVVERLSQDFRANRLEKRNPPSNALKELRNEVFDVVSRVRESPQQLIVMLDFVVRSSRDKAIAEILGRTRQQWKDVLVGILNRGIQQGVFRQEVRAETAAGLLQAQLTGLAMAGLTTPLKVKDMAEALLEQLHAWLANPQQKKGSAG